MVVDEHRRCYIHTLQENHRPAQKEPLHSLFGQNVFETVFRPRILAPARNEPPPNRIQWIAHGYRKAGSHSTHHQPFELAVGPHLQRVIHSKISPSENDQPNRKIDSSFVESRNPSRSHYLFDVVGDAASASVSSVE